MPGGAGTLIQTHAGFEGVLRMDGMWGSPMMLTCGDKSGKELVGPKPIMFKQEYTHPRKGHSHLGCKWGGKEGRAVAACGRVTVKGAAGSSGGGQTSG